MASKEREPVHPDIPRRKALKVAVSALCSEVGFGQAEHSAVETLTEMIQSCELFIHLLSSFLSVQYYFKNFIVIALAIFSRNSLQTALNVI